MLLNMTKGPTRRLLLTILLALNCSLILYYCSPTWYSASSDERLHQAGLRMFPRNSTEKVWLESLVLELSNSSLKYISQFSFVGCIDPHRASFYLKLTTFDCALFCIGRDLKYVGFYHANNTCTCWNETVIVKPVQCSQNSVLYFEQKYLQGEVIKNRLNSEYRGCTLLSNVPDGSLKVEEWLPKSNESCISYCTEKDFVVAIMYNDRVCFCSKYLTMTRQIYPDSKCDPHTSSKLGPKTFVKVYITPNAAKTCNDAKFAPEGTFPIIGLISPQGSGTTWTRFSIEQMTGYITGSAYNGPVDKALGLLGEGEPWNTGRSPVVKSHLAAGGTIQDVLYQSVKILTIVRNPMRAALSERNRRELRGDQGLIPGKNDELTGDFMSSKSKQAPLESFTSADFMNFSSTYITDFWMLKIQKLLSHEKTVMIMSYEDMQADLLSQLFRIRRFLNLETGDTLNRAFCTVEKQPVEAKTRKRNTTIDYLPYANFNSTVVASCHREISNLLLHQGVHLLRPLY